MNPITLFATSILTLAGAGSAYLGQYWLAGVLFLLALIVAASLKMANT
ncbi:hypothetical protein [Labrys sp. (in: a-proteobacteria)]